MFAIVVSSSVIDVSRNVTYIAAVQDDNRTVWPWEIRRWHTVRCRATSLRRTMWTLLCSSEPNAATKRTNTQHCRLPSNI